jgi:hypothetical protein
LVAEEVSEIGRSCHEGKKNACVHYSEYIPLLPMLLQSGIRVPFDDDLQKKHYDRGFI